jgi:hypothetical protein
VEAFFAGCRSDSWSRVQDSCFFFEEEKRGNSTSGYSHEKEQACGHRQ